MLKIEDYDHLQNNYLDNCKKKKIHVKNRKSLMLKIEDYEHLQNKYLDYCKFFYHVKNKRL